jgi:hypothetical protein
MTFPAMEYWDLLSAIVEANAEPISWTMFHLPESSEIEKQKWLNSPKARLLDLIKGGIDLPGHIGVGVFNFVAQTDITSVPLEFRGWGRSIGFGEEKPTGERIFWLALSAIPEAKLAGSSLVRSAEREVAISARGIGSIERSGVSISSSSKLTNSQIDLSILGSSAANTATLEANSIRFSQSSVKPVLGEYVSKMESGGWFGDPIDVVRMSDGGLTSIDNTRLAAASITNTPVQAIIRDASTAFPASRGPQFFGGATTWEEAVLNRINNPGNHSAWKSLYPNGSPFTGIRQGAGVIKQ